jgi:hypothetical protein
MNSLDRWLGYILLACIGIVAFAGIVQIIYILIER